MELLHSVSYRGLPILSHDHEKLSSKMLQHPLDPVFDKTDDGTMGAERKGNSTHLVLKTPYYEPSVASARCYE